MREIFDHKSGLANDPSDTLRVFACDDRGSGNANHEYIITLDDPSTGLVSSFADVNFQKGPLQENEFNGVSNESVLAIVIDRLKGFQAGPFACRENAIALTHLQDAQHWLHSRTRERAFRGVEGKTAA